MIGENLRIYLEGDVLVRLSLVPLLSDYDILLQLIDALRVDP